MGDSRGDTIQPVETECPRDPGRSAETESRLVLAGAGAGGDVD